MLSSPSPQSEDSHGVLKKPKIFFPSSRFENILRGLIFLVISSLLVGTDKHMDMGLQASMDSRCGDASERHGGRWAVGSLSVVSTQGNGGAGGILFFEFFLSKLPAARI
jgi:hypothetical protein